MPPTPSLEALEVRLNNLEKNVEDIKAEQRESQKLLTETLKKLQDNVIRQTTLMEKNEQRAEKQEQRLDKIDEKLEQVNVDVQTIKVRSEINHSGHQNESGEQSTISWLQNFSSLNNKYLWFAFYLILGTLLGLKVPDIMKIIGG
ncbi:hypothetical protein EDM57_21135 [Brevibacillus gelatini]|uniref:Uncharacterized protein n=1 Tax=Brevibacillus gelatini TaxID=1655277 RepID=A0A3M8ANA5_9BACL|nr:hypothetical protein [Brevibacillus gelatini]RNB52694.1 hypothetical protein EDM57_21135 [Brevibacillus gelatini]